MYVHGKIIYFPDLCKKVPEETTIDKNHTYYLTNVLLTEINFLERVPAVIGQKTGYTMDRWLVYQHRWLVHHRTVN